MNVDFHHGRTDVAILYRHDQAYLRNDSVLRGRLMHEYPIVPVKVARINQNGNSWPDTATYHVINFI